MPNLWVITKPTGEDGEPKPYFYAGKIGCHWSEWSADIDNALHWVAQDKAEAFLRNSPIINAEVQARPW